MGTNLSKLLFQKKDSPFTVDASRLSQLGKVAETTSKDKKEKKINFSRINKQAIWSPPGRFFIFVPYYNFKSSESDRKYYRNEKNRIRMLHPCR